MFFGKKKKENKIEGFNYVGFSIWLDKILQNPLPENTRGINFNVYEEAQPNTFGVQLVATSSFELNNDDWACDEIFSSNENMYFLPTIMVGSIPYKKLKKMLRHIWIVYNKVRKMG